MFGNSLRPARASARSENDKRPVEAGASARAGYGNRTRLSSLGSLRSTDELIPREGASIPAPHLYIEGVRSRGLPFVIVAATALIALLVYGLVAVGESTTLDDAVRRGERPVAPDQRLPKLGGGEGALADFKGKPVVLNFWASWCDPCKDEAPALVRAQKQLAAAGGTVVGVTVDDSTPDSLKFAKEHDLEFPSLRDVDNELGEQYGRTGVPETFVIDRQGRVTAISRGQIDDGFFERHLPAVLR